MAACDIYAEVRAGRTLPDGVTAAGRCCQRELRRERRGWPEHQDHIRLLSHAPEEEKRCVGREGDGPRPEQNRPPEVGMCQLRIR